MGRGTEMKWRKDGKRRGSKGRKKRGKGRIVKLSTEIKNRGKGRRKTIGKNEERKDVQSPDFCYLRDGM